MMVETSQTHRAELEHVPSAADFADAISDDPASAGLLSESEVESLYEVMPRWRRCRRNRRSLMFSLLFRTLQSAYGAYEYFGQEKFDAAEDAGHNGFPHRMMRSKFLRWEKNCRNLSHSCLRTTRMP